MSLSFTVISVASPLTLDEAVSEALAHNRQIRSAALRGSEADRRVDVEKSRRWPVLRTQGQFGAGIARAEVTFPKGSLGDYPATGPIPGSDTRVGIPRQFTGFAWFQAAQPLTQQFRIGAAIEGAKLQAQEARSDKQEADIEITRQVRQTYFNLLALDAAMRAAKTDVEVAVEVERLAIQGVQAGTALSVEQREAASRKQRAEATVGTVENDRENLGDALNQLLGRPLGTAVELAGLPIPAAEELTAEAVQRRALENRPDLEAARLRIRQTETATRGKKYEFIPDVSVGVNYFGFINTSNLAPANYAVAGLQLDWEPWDWGRKKAELRGLHAKADRERLELEERQQQVAREALQSLREWQQSERNLAAAESVAAARADMVRVMTKRYQEQAALLRQLLESQAEYETAQEQSVRALAARGVAWANLQYAMGVQK